MIAGAIVAQTAIVTATVEGAMTAGQADVESDGSRRTSAGARRRLLRLRPVV